MAHQYLAVPHSSETTMPRLQPQMGGEQSMENKATMLGDGSEEATIRRSYGTGVEKTTAV